MPVESTVSVLLRAGLTISSSPSQSLGIHSALCTRNARCCSFLAEYTMIAFPVRICPSIRAQSFSRTLAETCPTNTSGAISNSHRVKSPRSPTGQAVSTTTIITISRCLHIGATSRNLNIWCTELIVDFICIIDFFTIRKASSHFTEFVIPKSDMILRFSISI